VCGASCVVRRASCVVRRASCVVRRASCVVRILVEIVNVHWVAVRKQRCRVGVTNWFRFHRAIRPLAGGFRIIARAPLSLAEISRISISVQSGILILQGLDRQIYPGPQLFFQDSVFFLHRHPGAQVEAGGASQAGCVYAQAGAAQPAAVEFPKRV
jgi:hypothetical protein